MQPSNETIVENLNSGEPERIQSALRDLKTRMDEVNEIGLAPFGAEILMPFGETVPEETQLDFIEIMRSYHTFTPDLSAADRLSAMIAIVLGYAERYVTYEVALKLKISEHPAQLIEAAMQEIVRQGLLTPTHVKGAAYLVSRLLDGNSEVRGATLENLRMWSRERHYLEVKDYILPQLEPDEVEFLEEV
ncbi:hypothetical protein IQ250_15135 [Pseudanabaenaceae cyanobacterium LEGE 13415]|nr:hypothetical protein [Pseudanabaenaceae cyanobacterium LEGE 13415]